MAYNNGYGRGANPYAQQQDEGYTQPSYGGGAPPSYGGSQYGGGRQQMGRNEYAGDNVEMEPLTGTRAGFQQNTNPNEILEQCRQIDRGIDDIVASLGALKSMQDRLLNDPDPRSDSANKLEAKGAETMSKYRALAARIKVLKSKPESGSPKNAPQLGKVNRRLKAEINSYQRMESEFRGRIRDQMTRQYLIVEPNATQAEINMAVDDPTSNVFAQALQKGNRRGDAQSTLSQVQDRHAAIQKIEQQMVELAELFQDMEALVVQQEAAVAVIESKGEEVQENLYKGNEEIGTAIVSARARNRKKWWCLLIVVIIILIIVVVVVIYTQVINKPKTKRDLEAILNTAIKARYVVTENVGRLSNSGAFVKIGEDWAGDN